VDCCRLTINDGCEWVWIDTCRVDKRSSAGLSKAINSMYKWCWEAAICYACFSDVAPGRERDFQMSRWFTRGWTLQELLAPEVVEFYDAQWKPLGTKSRLVDKIAEFTNIEPSFVLSRGTVREAGIATKLSWMAGRTTKREEDMAYGLLGIAQVNMPMLYEDGKRAFHRLQLTIIRRTNDHSIFAWESERQPVSLLASSPSCF
jgi:hypothetical protein